MAGRVECGTVTRDSLLLPNARCSSPCTFCASLAIAFPRRPLPPIPPRRPKKESVPLQKSHARREQGPQGQTKHCQLSRLRLAKAFPSSLRKLLFIYQSSLEGEKQDDEYSRYPGPVVATHPTRALFTTGPVFI